MSSDAAPATSARDRMVATAAQLFRRHGYHAVGFRRIVEEADAPRGSIYHHFPDGKEQLAAEALHASGGALVRMVERLTGEAGTVAEAVVTLGELLATDLERSRFADGCPVATVALEVAPEDTPVSRACAVVFRTWITVVRDRLVAEGWSEERSQAFATTTVAAMEGALLLARVERDADTIRTVAATLAAGAEAG
ncbi:MAG: TetR/AcrR family transcriptional regulator [Nitriliruptoraceae bacterium]|nr:TetR/AcrR family transcriptional regulator [Nitriliruptoraceae bacterium]